jgi:hypothetical protein
LLPVPPPFLLGFMAILFWSRDILNSPLKSDYSKCEAHPENI